MIIRYLHNYSTRFESTTALRMKLVEECQDLVPDNLSFSVGYFEGQSHLKIWLMSREDFITMYVKYPKGEITLWCDDRSDETGDTMVSRKKRKKDGETSTRRQGKEDEVHDLFMHLKEKHGQNLISQGYDYGHVRYVETYMTLRTHLIYQHSVMKHRKKS